MSVTHLETTVAHIVFSERILFLRTIMCLCKNLDGSVNHKLLDSFRKGITHESMMCEDLSKLELLKMLEEKIEIDWDD